MRKMFLRGTALLAIAATLPLCTKAQEKVTADVGLDLVSGYVWRGQDLGNVSIQPALGVSYKGFSLSAWGSVGFEQNDTKEFDLTLAYTYGNFSVSVTDYWFNQGISSKTDLETSSSYFHYGSYETAHVFEAQIGYDFGVLSVNWYTNIGGNDGINEDGDRAYSSYITLAAPFRLGGIDWTAEVGATPWETSFYNDGASGFEVCNVSIGATKEIKITDSFSLPIFGQATWNPATGGAYFVVGLSL